MLTLTNRLPINRNSRSQFDIFEMSDTTNIKLVNLSQGSGSVDFKHDQWGVILFNMGSPESPDQVREYLKTIFCDKAIIKLPLSSILQRPLAELISRLRAKGSAEKYKLIGGSPLLDITDKLCGSVHQSLRVSYPNFKIYSAMRYTPPLIDDQIEKSIKDGCKYLLLIPMYPQYCHATTGSSKIEIEKYVRKNNPNIEIQMINDFHDHSQYMQLMQRKLDAKLDSLHDSKKTIILFSAHTIPESLVQSGDPYVEQIAKSSKLTAGRHEYKITYQSRTGPVKWVGPDTFEMVEKLKDEGYQRVVIVPISFVADNLETLYDIDIVLKQHCKRLGMELERIECPNFSEDFVDVIASLIKDTIHMRSSV